MQCYPAYNSNTYTSLCLWSFRLLPHLFSRSKEKLLTEIGSLLTEIAFLKEVREQLVSVLCELRWPFECGPHSTSCPSSSQKTPRSSPSLPILPTPPLLLAYLCCQK